MADENDNSDNSVQTENNDAPKKRTSKDIVAGDDKRTKALETQVSDLQRLRQEDKTLIDELSKVVKAAKEAPSARKPGKSILDELNDFMGFTSETDETNTQSANQV